MSVLDKDKVDGIGKSKEENKIALMIADHLEWEDELQHLTILQEKINAYISFIESEQIFESYPLAKTVDGYIIDIRFKNPPTKNCENFLSVVAKNIEMLKIELQISEA